MSKTAVSMTLPNVGDKLVRIMTSTTWDIGDVRRPEPCVVTYINKTHGWFEVRFLDSGIKECYKLPVFDHSIIREAMKGATPVMCVETGIVYSTLHQCARDLGLSHGGISRHLNGESSHCGGYHFCTVL